MHCFRHVLTAIFHFHWPSHSSVNQTTSYPLVPNLWRVHLSVCMRKNYNRVTKEDLKDILPYKECYRNTNIQHTPCPRKKTSHFNFRHNFAICWDILHFLSILFRNNPRMTKYSTYSPRFIYVVVRRIETVSYKNAQNPWKTLEIGGWQS